MSREIKFRIWDKEIKEYQYITLSDLGEDDYYWFDGETSLWFVLYDSTHEQERFIIEQYTGLEDVNGTNIYSGDIVNTHDDENNPTLLEIDWEFGGFVVVEHYGDCSGDRDPISDFHYNKFEVVGNIHEDKEMLQ